MLHVRTSRDSIQFWFIVGKNTLKTKLLPSHSKTEPRIVQNQLAENSITTVQNITTTQSTGLKFSVIFVVLPIHFYGY